MRALAKCRLATRALVSAARGLPRLAEQAELLQHQLEQQLRQRQEQRQQREQREQWKQQLGGGILGSIERLKALSQIGKLDCAACVAVLARCGATGAWREAQQVTRLLKCAGVEPDVPSLARAATAAAAGGQSQLACRLLAEARAWPMELDKDARTVLLQSCRAVEDAAAAFSVLEQIRAQGAWASTAGMQHLLVACSHGGEWRRARSALESAEAPPPAGGGLHTDARQWNAVLAGCVRAGELGEGRALLEQMRQRGVARLAGGRRSADTTSYNTLMHGYVPEWAGGEGQPERAVRAEGLLAAMRADGCVPDGVTFAALFDVHQFDASRVSALLRDMSEAGVAGRAARTAYAKAARSLLWAGRAQEAWELIGRMEDEGVRLNATLYSRMMAAAESVGLHDEADRLHRRATAQLGAGWEATLVR